MRIGKTISIFLAVVFCFSAFAAPPKKAKKPAAPSPVKNERVTFKQFNENDPTTKADNTITVIQNDRELQKPIHETWNEEHLKMFQEKDVNVTSTYNLETGSYIVTGVVPFQGY